MRCNYCGMQNDDNATVCANPNCGKPLGKVHSKNMQVQPQPSVIPHRPTILEDGALGLQQSSQPNFVQPDQQAIHNYGQQPQSNCPKCQYPLQPGVTVCPNCNTPVKVHIQHSQQEQNNHHPTVIGSIDDINRNFDGNGVVSFGLPNPQERQNQNNQKQKTKPPFGGTVNPYIQKMLETEFTLKPVKKENERHQPQDLTFSGDEVVLNRGNLEQNNMSITSRTHATITYEDGKFYIVDGSDFKTTFVQARQKTELHEGDIILMGDRMFEFHS